MLNDWISIWTRVSAANSPNLNYNTTGKQTLINNIDTWSIQSQSLWAALKDNLNWFKQVLVKQQQRMAK